MFFIRFKKILLKLQKKQLKLILFSIENSELQSCMTSNIRLLYAMDSEVEMQERKVKIKIPAATKIIREICGRKMRSNITAL